MTPPGLVRVSLPFCGLPCPPALLTFEEDRVATVDDACGACRAEAKTPRTGQPRVAGKDATLEAALDRALELLAESRRPLVYGLAASPVGTARLAARLAARLDAALDVEGAELLEPELAAIAATGQVTATFGDMRAAADLVILWRVDPRSTHPQLFPDRMEGGGPRRFVVVPPLAPDDPDVPYGVGARDRIVGVPPGRDLQVIQFLRRCLNAALPGHDPGVLADRGAGGAAIGAAGASLPVAEIQEAAAAIAAARRVALLWDSRIATGPEGTAIASGFALLTLDVRSAPRIAAKALGPRGHVTGAMAGLLSATGFPRAIGFASGNPRRDPDRFGAARLIDGGGADLVLALEPLRPERLSSCPAIVIGSRRSGGREPEVFLPVAPAALRGDGLWLRADGVPLPRHAAEVTSPATGAASRRADARASTVALPSEADILTALLDRLRAAA